MPKRAGQLAFKRLKLTAAATPAAAAETVRAAIGPVSGIQPKDRIVVDGVMLLKSF